MNSIQLEASAARLFTDNHVDICSLDTLPTHHKNNILCIINTDTSNLPGKHWIALMVRQKTAYIFDSFGEPPPSTLVHWLSLRGISWSSNTRCVQSPLTETCGLYCLYFLWFATAHSLRYANYIDIMNLLFPKHASYIFHEQTILSFANVFSLPFNS